MNIFEQASIQKLRFPSLKGELTTEQLWDLPLQSKSGFDLDNVARTVSRLLKETTEESFVTPTANTANSKLTLAMDLVKHVIASKVQHAEAMRRKIDLVNERNKLLNILADKQEDALKSLTPEDIKKRLAEIDAA